MHPRSWLLLLAAFTALAGCRAPPAQVDRSPGQILANLDAIMAQPTLRSAFALLGGVVATRSSAPGVATWTIIQDDAMLGTYTVSVAENGSGTSMTKAFTRGSQSKPRGDHIDATGFVREVLPELLDAATDRAAVGRTLSTEEAPAITGPWVNDHPEIRVAIGRRLAPALSRLR